MIKSVFLKLLDTYEISRENVYEDLSELGIVLWHNDRMGVKITWEQDRNPCLVIVILCPSGNYSFFECDFTQFDGRDIKEICQYVDKQGNALYELALASKDSMKISVDEDSWIFRKAYI